MSQAGQFYQNDLITSLTGDVGGAIVAVAGNIDILGGAGISVTGTPGTLTIALSGAFSDSFPTDAGTAVPVAGDTNIFGGTNINTTGAGNTVTIILDDDVTLAGFLDAGTTITAGTGITATTGDILASAGNITATLGSLEAGTTVTAGTTVYGTTFDTNVVAAGVTLTGTTLSADGTDANIDINITAKGTGQVIIDDLQLTTDLEVQYGGTGASTFTDHGVLVGSGATPITALAAATDGQLIIGSTGADPTVGSISSTDGSLTITPGAGTLVIEGTDATEIQDGVVELATDAEAIAGADTVRAIVPTSLKAKLGTQTDHAILVGSGDAAAITALAVGATGEILIGNTGADPSWSSTFTITTINATTVNATTFDTDVAAAGVTLSGTTLSADGTDSDIDINITAKGTGQVIIDDLQLTTDLAVTEGGTGVSTFTDHSLLVGSGTAAITALAVGGTGVILQGSAGADPVWSTATYPSTVAIGDVLVASGANVIGVVTGGTTAGHVLTANGAGTAPTFQASAGGGTVTSVSGGTNINATGTGTDPIMNLDAAITLTTVNATTFDTNVAAAAVTLAGTTLSADGTDADIDINITAKGTGQVIIDDLQLTTDLAVTEGGTGASSLTDHGVLVGSGAGAVTALAVGTNGQVLVGSTGADPVFASLASADSSIEFSTGAGTLDLSVTGQLTLNNQTGTTYELVAGDAGKHVTCSNVAAITVTIPVNADVAMAIGSTVMISQIGAGTVTLAPEGGVTLSSRGSLLDTAGQYAVVTVTKILTDQWIVSGDLA